MSAGLGPPDIAMPILLILCLRMGIGEAGPVVRLGDSTQAAGGRLPAAGRAHNEAEAPARHTVSERTGAPRSPVGCVTRKDRHSGAIAGGCVGETPALPRYAGE